MPLCQSQFPGPSFPSNGRETYNVPEVLAALNILFLAFHTALIGFNVLGWIWTRTRPWNLATQMLTLTSWIGMGATKGWGYCLCTDLHWKIRRDMGITDDPPTYVGFLIQKVTGVLPSDAFVFWLTLSVFLVSFVASISLNLRDLRRRKVAPARP